MGKREAVLNNGSVVTYDDEKCRLYCNNGETITIKVKPNRKEAEMRKYINERWLVRGRADIDHIIHLPEQRKQLMAKCQQCEIVPRGTRRKMSEAWEQLRCLGYDVRKERVQINGVRYKGMVVRLPCDVPTNYPKRGRPATKNNANMV